MPGRRLLLILALGTACRRGPGETTTPLVTLDPAAGPATTSEPPPPPKPRAAGELPPRDAPAAQLTEAQQQQRLRGLAAMDAGRFDLARREFGELLEVVPGNLAVQALFDAATRALQAARQESALSFANIAPTPVAAPPWRYKLVREVPVAAPGPTPRLLPVRAAHNGITDEAQWFEQHQLALPEYEVPNPMRGLPGNLPPTIPPTYGKYLLVQAIAHPDHTILFYGPDYSGARFVAVVDAGGAMIAFLDFESYRLAPDHVAADATFIDQAATWAQLVDGVLYISHGHNTYARSSKGMTAYITAIDLATGELLWRSAPLVAGAANFVIDGGHIYSGYGFTAEPDHVFVLDRRTGKTVAKAKVGSAPEYLFKKGSRLLVRTYDTDHEFEIR